MPNFGATFYPGGMDDYYMPEVLAPSPQRYVSKGLVNLTLPLRSHTLIYTTSVFTYISTYIFTYLLLYLPLETRSYSQPTACKTSISMQHFSDLIVII